MAIHHDGISAPLPKNPLSIVIGLALCGVGGWLLSQASYTLGAAALFFGVLGLVNLFGQRRIKVIHSKLLVEDEHLLRMILIGPARRRIDWTEVSAVEIDGRSLRLKTKGGADFVTAQGADPAELKLLVERIERARREAAKGG